MTRPHAATAAASTSSGQRRNNTTKTAEPHRPGRPSWEGTLYTTLTVARASSRHISRQDDDLHKQAEDYELQLPYQGSFCSPAPVRRYPGATVSGSARTRSTRADPAVSGVSSSPICCTNSSSVWPLRAAYARIPCLPTSPNGVIRGITAVTVRSSPARRDSSRAYSAMNRWVALDPAYPPLAGEPLRAAPLLTTTTRLPGGSGFSSASRTQVNAILTSACQWTENVSQVWYWIGRFTGLAPATTMRTSGWYWSSTLHDTAGSAASATSIRIFV